MKLQKKIENRNVKPAAAKARNSYNNLGIVPVRRLVPSRNVFNFFKPAYSLGIFPLKLFRNTWNCTNFVSLPSSVAVGDVGVVCVFYHT